MSALSHPPGEPRENHNIDKGKLCSNISVQRKSQALAKAYETLSLHIKNITGRPIQVTPKYGLEKIYSSQCELQIKRSACYELMQISSVHSKVKTETTVA